MNLRSGVLWLFVACAWSVLFAWLGWIYHSERTYARDFVERLAKRAAIPVYTPGYVATWRDDGKLLFAGWSVPETGFRWSGARKAVLMFKLRPGCHPEAAYRLKMHFAYSMSTQQVTILFNKSPVADFTLQGAGLVDVAVAGELLHDVNIVELLLPGATPPGPLDLRPLAVAMVDFVLQPAV